MPKALQRRVINISHEGHQGIVKTKQLLHSTVWFPGMDRMTDNIVRSWLPCQAEPQQKPKEPLQMTELPERPWQKISLDFSGPYSSEEYCLIGVDDYSRYPVVELVSTTSAAAVRVAPPLIPLVLKNRDTQEGRDTNLHDLRIMCVDRDTKIDHLRTLKELSSPNTRNIERDWTCLFILIVTTFFFSPIILFCSFLFELIFM